MKTFVDTGGWIAVVVEANQYHDLGVLHYEELIDRNRRRNMTRKVLAKAAALAAVLCGAAFFAANAAAEENKANVDDHRFIQEKDAEGGKEMTAENPANLALHKPYVMDPPGNYRYGEYTMCTGPEDATDLTDGKHVLCKGGRIWFYQGTVGVVNLSQRGLGRVIIDLGESHLIGQVRVYASRMPGAGVQLPPLCLCLADEPDELTNLTNDQKEYVWTDRKIAKIPLPDPDAEFIVTPTELDGHGVRARFVCVALLRGAMMDEIEVFAAPREEPATGFPVLQYGEMPARMLFPEKHNLQNRSLMADLLTQLTKKSAGGVEKEYFLSWLWDIEEDHRQAMERMDEAACQQVADSVLSLNREGLASRFSRTALVVWAVTPYATPDPMSVPESPNAEYRLNLLAGQKGLAAFNVAWAGEEKTTATVTMENPPAGVELRRAYRMTTPQGSRVADALLLMDNGQSIELNPGQVEQVVVVALPDFPGGKVSLQLQTAGGVKASASVEVKRCKIKLPDEFDYPIWAWDYLDWPRPYVEAAELGAFLQPYHFNLATLTCSPIRDTAKFDEQGNVTTPPDFSTWEKALDAQKYCKWFYCGYPPELSNPNWEAKYSNILTLIKGFFEKRGIQPEQIYFAAADEDHDPAKWSAAKKVRDRVAPGIKLFSTGYIPGPDNVYFNSIDIFVNTGGSGVRLADLPVFNGFEEKYPKVTFIQYDCGSTFDSDPGRYRLYPWRNMRLGWRGVGLWTRDDSLWKATMGYQLFYDKANAPAELKVKENLFPSRRLEAFRAGLEDRWILEEAQRLAGRRLEKNPNDPFAQGILDFVDRSLARAFERETDPYVAEDAIQWLVPRLDALTG